MTSQSSAPPVRRAVEGEARADAASRLASFQSAIERSDLDAVVLASEANFTYVTGYCTPAWAMTARPLAVVITAERCTAVVGSAEAEPLGRACPDLEIATYTEPVIRDLGAFSIMDFAEAATDVVRGLLDPERVHRLGIEGSVPSASGLPYSCVTRLARDLDAELADVAALIWPLRARKTAYEIDRLRYVGHAQGRMYELFEEQAAPGMTERELQRLVQWAAGRVDIDRLAFSLVIAGAGEPADGPPGSRVWQQGDLLFMDTGLVADGYWADFSRHYAAGDARAEFTDAYARIVAATVAGREACQVGATAADVARAELAALPAPPPGVLGSIGRMGHGIGLDLTEPPSVNTVDDTPLLAGMTVTVEPLCGFAFGFLSSEEMVVVLDDGPALLSPPFPAELGVLGRPVTGPDTVLADLTAAGSANPPGDEVAVAGVIETVASSLGLPEPEWHTQLPGRPNLTIEIGSGHPTLLVASHMDTVPPGDAASWGSDPLRLRRDGDRYFGLGVADMKGAIAAALFAAARFQRGHHAGRLLLAFTADEEGSGDCGVPWLLQQGVLAADAAIMLEPASVTDESWDGLYVTSRGSTVVELSVSGLPGHTSIAEDPGLRAGRRLMDALAAIYEKDLFPDTGHPLDRSPPLTNPPSVLRGGVTPWQHPDGMTAQIEIRTVPGMTPQSVREAFVAALAARDLHHHVRVSVGAWGEPPATTTDPRLLSAAAAALTTVTGREIEPGVFPAITDGIHTAAAGIPTLHAFGPGTLRAVHRPDEWLRADDLERCVRLLDALFTEYHEQPSGVRRRSRR